MFFRTIFGEIGIMMCFQTFFTWLLFSLVSSQNKGDRFRVLQTSESFQLVLGNLGSSTPTPGYFMVGGWFKWNRCTYASTKASISDHDFLEPTAQRNWLPMHLSAYHNTERRVFNCSTWQHIAMVYQIDPSTGSMTPAHVLHKPMLRPPLNFDEITTTNTVEVVLVPNSMNRRLNVDADLVQHRLFWYLDYTVGGDIHEPQGVVTAYTQIVSGLTSPLIWVLNTERYFNIPTAVRVNDTTVQPMMLTSFINDRDFTYRPGFSLRWNTTYEFPDLIQLPEVDGEYAIEPCITLILSFRVDTQSNKRYHKISVSADLVSSNHSLLRDFNITMDFWTKGGTQNGSVFSIPPQNPRYQNLT